MGRRFDDFAKALAGNVSRRQTLKGTVAALLGLGIGAHAISARADDDHDHDRLIAACCRHELGPNATAAAIKTCFENAEKGIGICAHVTPCCPDGQICIQIQNQNNKICVPAFDD